MDIRKEIEEFYSGESSDCYRFLGCHRDGDGYVFRLWAPNARSVRLAGDFNAWQGEQMGRVEGIWELRTSSPREFDCYKYLVEGADGIVREKCDPYAFHAETRPRSASKICDIDGFAWNDGDYIEARKKYDPLASPVSIYEVHAGSWKKYADGSPFSYEKLAEELVPYVKEMGFTHVEFLPVTEYPLDDSWGYQVTGWFAPTSRYGTPYGFMKLIDAFHAAGIGVILDWVGAHFPKDAHGLSLFDGTPCYESGDPLMSEHPEWGTKIFDFSRNEVASFLSSSVCFWLDKYHIDGIRADAVASMIYLDYARKPGQWRPAPDGSNINGAAVELLRKINRAAFRVNPSAIMSAEESTSFPMVTRPWYDGGLGFGFKWDMGWMHDTLDYMSADPVMRRGLHEKLTFGMTYAFGENYILPLSHDEVVHGKKSMIGRMPGSYETKFASLRLTYSYMFAHPGKKLNFMGNEIGQFIEWDYKRELDWLLLAYDEHRELQSFFRALNRFYKDTPALWENDCGWDGFEWLTVDDRNSNVIAFLRRDRKGGAVAAVFNFSPVGRKKYGIHLPRPMTLKPVFSSDGEERKTVRAKSGIYGFYAETDLLPLSAVFYRCKIIQAKEQKAE
ncbi:MAG: 1,4-alpha-glucan branching protein GlgB [Clostridia bacterium]|nr:1,4-alpha-glucan branching protein GlgB [Clostridia bacterium]